MLKRFPKLILIFVLLVVALACITPAGLTTPDPNFINTAIAQTQTAAPAIPITGQDSLTPTATRAPSATPFPTFTLVVLGPPLLSVSADTICRTGPGDIYDRVGVLRVGEVAEVVGRSADGNFWVIRDPDGTDNNCWISGQNATLTGIASSVPVLTPPPTPTPTRTRAPFFTSTPTRTRTPVRTSTPTRAPTRTPTRPFTPTSTNTSSIPTASPTITPTPTLTSSTPTTSPTATATFSPTPTSSPTPTPSFTPTPTPTSTSTSSPTPTSTPSPTSSLPPAFTASFSKMESCTGTGWWVDLEFQNTGGLAFESIFVLLSDTVTGTTLSLNSEDFTNRDGCSTSNTQPDLPPGTTRIVSLPAFTDDPSGHPLGATVILCSDPSHSGTCMAKTVNFTP